MYMKLMQNNKIALCFCHNIISCNIPKYITHIITTIVKTFRLLLTNTKTTTTKTTTTIWILLSKEHTSVQTNGGQSTEMPSRVRRRENAGRLYAHGRRKRGGARTPPSRRRVALCVHSPAPQTGSAICSSSRAGYNIIRSSAPPSDDNNNDDDDDKYAVGV